MVPEPLLPIIWHGPQTEDFSSVDPSQTFCHGIIIHYPSPIQVHQRSPLIAISGSGWIFHEQFGYVISSVVAAVYYDFPTCRVRSLSLGASQYALGICCGISTRLDKCGSKLTHGIGGRKGGWCETLLEGIKGGLADLGYQAA